MFRKVRRVAGISLLSLIPFLYSCANNPVDPDIQNNTPTETTNDNTTNTSSKSIMSQ